MDKSIQYLDGWLAHRLREPIEVNPYNERIQGKSHSEWQSGWCDRFSAVKHGLELVCDEVT